MAAGARTRRVEVRNLSGEFPELLGIAGDALPSNLTGLAVRVGGRPGRVFWDGRPEHNYVSLDWSDDGSKSGIIAVHEVFLDEVANMMAAHASGVARRRPPNVEGSITAGWYNSTGNGTVYVGVISAPGNEQKRHEVREKWLTAARERFVDEGGGQPRVQLEFIIGRVPVMAGNTGRIQGATATDDEMALEARIANEQAVYGDIFRIAAAESYSELPDKVLLMLGRALQGGYDFVVKVDDDQHLDMDKVLWTVESEDPRDPLYSGAFLWDEERFPSQVGADGEFRKYYGGPCYLLSHSLVDRIAREHFSHSIAYNLYGGTSEDVDMGRWVAFEDQLLAEQGAKRVKFRTVWLSRAL